MNDSLNIQSKVTNGLIDAEGAWLDWSSRNALTIQRLTDEEKYLLNEFERHLCHLRQMDCSTSEFKKVIHKVNNVTKSGM